MTYCADLMTNIRIKITAAVTVRYNVWILSTCNHIYYSQDAQFNSWQASGLLVARHLARLTY